MKRPLITNNGIYHIYNRGVEKRKIFLNMFGSRTSKHFQIKNGGIKIMKRPPFINSYIYHIYNRGVEKRDIFLDKKDYLRFIHDLYEFNNEDPAPPSNIRLNTRYPSQSPCLEVRLPNIPKSRKRLVDILAFCLMPNHYHLLLRQKQEKGITEFLRKLGTGYTNYFNLKYKRVGPLFQGKFKAVLVENDNYLLNLICYIHLNPIELIDPDWKINGIKNFSKANRFLNKYRWSSYLDYIGTKNFPSLTQRDFINLYFNKPNEYKRFIQDYILPDDKLKDLILE